MDISIIIVNFNSLKYTKECINSILKSRDNFKKEIIVVDNNSSDDSCRSLADSFPDISLLPQKVNLGFARGNNIGIQKATGEYLLFLNPDTTLNDDSIPKLMDFYKQNPDTGIAAPKLRYGDGSLQLSCRAFYNLRTILSRRLLPGIGRNLADKHLMKDWAHDQVKQVDWVLAACMLIRRDIMEKLGCFDGNYRLYFEDVDLCYRMKLAGYIVYYYPFCEVIHHHQRDSAKGFSMKTLWHIRSMIRFFNKFGWKF